MKNRKTVKIAAFITLILLFANEIVFYFTNQPKEINSLLFLFLGLNSLIALSLYIFSLLSASMQVSRNELDSEEKQILDQHSLENELRKIDKQKNEAEALRMQLKLKEVDEKASEMVDNLISKKTMHDFADSLLVNLSKYFSIAQGLFFVRGETDIFTLIGSYAYYSERGVVDFEIGEGLSGQVAKNKKLLNISNIPDGYITILSGTGSGQTNHLLIFPIIHNNKTIAIIELASFSAIDSFGEELIVAISHRVSEALSVNLI